MIVRRLRRLVRVQDLGEGLVSRQMRQYAPCLQKFVDGVQVAVAAVVLLVSVRETTNPPPRPPQTPKPPLRKLHLPPPTPLPRSSADSEARKHPDHLQPHEHSNSIHSRNPQRAIPACLSINASTCTLRARPNEKYQIQFLRLLLRILIRTNPRRRQQQRPRRKWMLPRVISGSIPAGKSAAS